MHGQLHLAMRADLRSYCIRAAFLGGLLLLAPGRAATTQSSVPRATLSEDLRIDAKKEDFALLNGGVVGPRGVVALTFRQDAQVRIYDANGKRIAVVGRPGSGPGEFRSPQAQGWIADTLWIYDFTLKRHTFVAANGRLIRVAPLEGTTRPLRLTGSDSLATLTDWFPRARRADGGTLGMASIIRSSRSGSSGRENVVVSATVAGLATRILNGGIDPRWEPAFWFPHTATSSDGLEAVRVDVTDLLREGASLVVTRVGWKRDTIFVRRMPYQGVAMSQRRIDSVLKQAIDPHFANSVPKARIPAVYAPVTGVFAHPNGMTWLRLRETESAEVMLMLNRKGATVARWPIPPGAYLMDATATHVWLKEEDADGLYSAVRYRISCGGRECR